MKILVYDDNPDFGGHQIMACHGVEALVADPGLEVVFMLNPQNRKLADRLRRSGIPARPVQAGMPAPRPDLVLGIQGDIGQSTKGMRAAKRAGIECVSYIAIPHRLTDMGARLGALRDRLNQRLLSLPDRFVTISESMKALLVERGATQPITVVPNGIPPVPNLKPKAPGPFTLGLLGRIEFNQKRQDFMVRAFREFPKAFGDCRLLIAGDGPDRHRLRRMVGGAENISLLPWQEESETFYGQIDLLLVPSRYEGVPLVMLEALARGIPVVGSRRDGMADTLPEAWTFEPGNAADLADVFSRVRNGWKDEIGEVRKRVETEHAPETFKTRFLRAVTRPRGG